MLAYLGQEAGADHVERLLGQARSGDARLLLSDIHAGEVYYVEWSRRGREHAERVWAVLDELPLEQVSVDRDLIRLAATLKALIGLPYVDSFAAAVALRESAQIVTRDQDFRRLKDAREAWGRVPVVMLR